MEGSSLKLDVIRQARDLVVMERMLQGQRVKNTKAKQEVPGWSGEEVKESLMSLWRKTRKR